MSTRQRAINALLCGQALHGEISQNLCLNPSETPVLVGSPSFQLRMIFAEIELVSLTLYVRPVANSGVL